MANRLVLVPEDLYRGLLSAPTRPLALDNDDIGAQYTKRKMFAARRNKTLNASTRNTLYQQELRRFLKMRKQAKEKPIKVELDNMVNLLTKMAAANSEAVTTDPENDQKLVGFNEANMLTPATKPKHEASKQSNENVSPELGAQPESNMASKKDQGKRRRKTPQHLHLQKRHHKEPLIYNPWRNNNLSTKKSSGLWKY